MLSFCMRQSTADNEWANKDGGDHYVTIPAGQSTGQGSVYAGRGNHRGIAIQRRLRDGWS